MDAVTDNLGLFLDGYLTSLRIILIALVGSLVLGLVVAMCRVSPVPPLQTFGTAWVTTFRNTPLSVVLFACAFGLPELGLNRTFFFFGVLGLVLYTSAFVCEAIRAGINSVSAGQAEAARSIGLNFTQGLRHVVLPQALRTVVPPLGSLFIALIKNSALAALIAVEELAGTAEQLISDTARPLPIFFGVAIAYLMLTLPAGVLVGRLERRLAIAR